MMNVKKIVKRINAASSVIFSVAALIAFVALAVFLARGGQ